MKKGVIIGLIVLLGLAVLFYNHLGGFNELQIRTLDGVSYKIAGKFYSGRYKDRQIEEDFNEIKAKVEQNELDGIFAIITYKEPSQHEGEIELFTGVILNDMPQELPENYEIREITASKAVEASLEAHPAVFPTAENVRVQMQEYAVEQGLELQEITIDKYLGEGHLGVVIPAK